MSNRRSVRLRVDEEVLDRFIARVEASPAISAATRPTACDPQRTHAHPLRDPTGPDSGGIATFTRGSAPNSLPIDAKTRIGRRFRRLDARRDMGPTRHRTGRSRQEGTRARFFDR